MFLNNIVPYEKYRAVATDTYFVDKTADSSEIFDKLKIAALNHYRENLHQHNVIYIDFSDIPENCDSYSKYIERMLKGLKKDLQESYPEIISDSEEAVWDIMTKKFQKTRQQFIFVLVPPGVNTPCIVWLKHPSLR